MEAPPSIQYVRTPDGFDIALRTAGSGAAFVVMPSVLSPMEGSWERFPNWFAGIVSSFALVQYDSRGQGFSQRGLPASLSLTDLALDLDSAVKHLRLDRFVLWAAGGFGHVAVHYALLHPDQIEALILHFCCLNNAAWGSTLWEDLPSENWTYFLESLIPPGLPPLEQRKRIKHLQNASTFEDYRILTSGVLMRSSIAAVVGQLRVPTLVLHPRESAMLPVSESMALAAAIPDARFALLEGQDYHPDSLAHIQGFLADIARSRPAKPADLTQALSRREEDVLHLIARGLSNQQMADELVISVRTVERHINHIYVKLGVHNRAQAAAYAVQHRGAAG